MTKQAVNSNGTPFTGTVTNGSPLYYDIKIANYGTVDASNTTLTDLMPTGFTTSTAATCSVPRGALAVCPSVIQTPAGGYIFNQQALKTTSGGITTGALPAGSQMTFRVSGSFTSNVPTPVNVITNTATITPPSSFSCAAVNGVTPCSSSDTVSTNPLIAVTKDVQETGPLYPGQTANYLIRVMNKGGFALTNVVVSDPLPAGYASATWYCQKAAGDQTPCPTGTSAGGSLGAGGTLTSTIASLPAGKSLEYVVQALVQDENTLVNTVSTNNTVTVTPSNATWLCLDPNTGLDKAKPCTSSAPILLVPKAKLAITKTVPATPTVYYAGNTVSYTVTVKNVGGGPIGNVKVDDTVPGSFSSVTWSCSPSANPICDPATFPGMSTGSTLAVTGLSLAASESVVFTAQAVVGSVSGVNGVTNIATASSTSTTAPWTCADMAGVVDAAKPCLASVLVVLSATPQLGITKSASGPGPFYPTNQFTYTVRVENNSSVAASNVTVTDPQSGASNFSSVVWACTASNAALCNGFASTGAPLSWNLPAALPGAGGWIQFVATATVAPRSTVATVPNTAQVTAAAPWTCATPLDSSNLCTATANVTLSPNAGVSIAKAIAATPTPPSIYYTGDTVHYTITVSSTTPVALSNVLVTDALPTPDFASVNWTCSSSVSANTFCSGFSSSALTLNATLPTLAGNEVVVFTGAAKLGTVDGSKASLPNTATVAPSATNPPWACAASGCSASVPITLSAKPQLSIVKAIATTPTPPAVYYTGDTVNYTITVTNPSTAIGVSDVLVTDALPTPDFASVVWSCTASAATNTFCTTFNADTTANTALSLGTTIPSLGKGESVVFTAKAKLGTVDGSKATLPNTAEVKSTSTTVPWECVPATTGACQSTVPVNLSATPKLSIEKLVTGGVGPYYSNQDVTYTITVKNHGPVAVSDMLVNDTLPAAFASAAWTCAANGTSACPTFSPTGLALSVSDLALAPNDSVTFTAVAKLGSITANVNGVANTATVGAITKSGKLTKAATTTFACVATDGTTALTMPCQSTALINLAVDPQLAIVKSVTTTATTYYAGDAVSYAIKVSNPGNVALTNVDVTDTLVTGLEAGTWSCVPGATTPCPSGMPSGAAQVLAVMLPSLAAGETVTFNVTTKVSATPPASIPNTATTKSSDAQTKCVGGASMAMPCVSSVSITTGTKPATGDPKPVPLDQPWMLALMSLALIGTAGAIQRRRARSSAHGKR
ncbi:hypothetical protein [Diaphorobacter sp. HDW4B]|uniref:DUF7507 domain-containing protein n=1 Tax=Diaphorobacter sp. HDW4B TaxID=2714925 RepID=UPI001F0D20CA|nr:hypothetical protein [Diaphorobacter sp. HDW4B]